VRHDGEIGFDRRVRGVVGTADIIRAAFRHEAEISESNTVEILSVELRLVDQSVSRSSLLNYTSSRR
jgi:hypothetical protein